MAVIGVMTELCLVRIWKSIIQYGRTNDTQKIEKTPPSGKQPVKVVNSPKKKTLQEDSQPVSLVVTICGAMLCIFLVLMF